MISDGTGGLVNGSPARIDCHCAGLGTTCRYRSSVQSELLRSGA